MQQRHPELAKKILLAQKIFLAVDIGMLLQNYYQLYKTLYKRYVVAKVVANLSHSPVMEAQNRLEAARLNCSQLMNSIKDEVDQGNILKIYGNMIPLSPASNQLIQNVHKAVDEKEIILTPAGFQGVTPSGQQLVQNMNRAFDEGEVVFFNDYIPLCHEAIPLIKEFKLSRKNKEIIYVENGVLNVNSQGSRVSEQFNNAIAAHQVALVDEVSHLLPLSLHGKTILAQFMHAVYAQSISWTGEGYVCANEEAKQILDQLQNAFANLDIISTNNGFIPLTSEAKSTLKHFHNSFPDALAELEEATKQLPEAQEKERLSQASLTKEYTFNLFTAMGKWTIALAGLSALSVTLSSRLLRPSLDLTEILKKVASLDVCKNMTIQWSLPWLQYASQCLIVSRMMVSLALAAFSTDRRAFTLSAFFQGFTFWKLSQMFWIKLDKTYFGSGSVKTAIVSFEILLPSFSTLKESCASLSFHFEAQLKSICDYTSKFFDGSWWNSYWTHTDRTLQHDIFLRPSTFATCVCKVSPILERVTSAVVDIQGSAKMNFKWP
ncbi:MAG TPA: hypothetical protein VHA52_06160 [Candidatus Babeliaceae bacterium]|nr:hypothetical protein [Candidatus Babeliaceae bacterium]